MYLMVIIIINYIIIINFVCIKLMLVILHVHNYGSYGIITMDPGHVLRV